jgi:hypothetical protein
MAINRLKPSEAMMSVLRNRSAWHKASKQLDEEGMQRLLGGYEPKRHPPCAAAMARPSRQHATHGNRLMQLMRHVLKRLNPINARGKQGA